MTGRTPTTDIYLGSALATIPALQAIEADAFALGGNPAGTVIVVRKCSPALACRLLARPPERLIVVMDDDLPAIVRDGGQPPGFRWRTWRAVRQGAWRLLPVADDVVVSCEALARRTAPLVRRGHLHVLAPALTALLPDLAHHDEGGHVRAVLLDTRSHRADYTAIAPLLREALDRWPMLRLTTFLGDHAPAGLVHEHAEHRAPMRWDEFRERRGQMRHHLSLAPRRETAVNASRSITRLLDNTMIGAAGLYGHNPAISAALEAAGAPGWTHGLTNDDWANALDRMVGDATRRKREAERTARIGATVGDPRVQSRFWHGLLGIGTG